MARCPIYSIFLEVMTKKSMVRHRQQLLCSCLPALQYSCEYKQDDGSYSKRSTSMHFNTCENDPGLIAVQAAAYSVGYSLDGPLTSRTRSTDKFTDMWSRFIWPSAAMGSANIPGWCIAFGIPVASGLYVCMGSADWACRVGHS
eukprot:jgi/Chrzof1/1115/Cz01g40190.t1